MSMSATNALAKPRKGFFARAGRQIGLQLYTLGDEPAQDLDGTLGKLATIGYKDLELPGMLGKTPVQLRAAAERAGVRFSSIHLPGTAMMAGGGLSFASPVQQIADALGVMGIASAVLPIMLLPDNFLEAPGASFPEKIASSIAGSNGDIWKRTAAVLNEQAAALRSAGIAVGYHNHNVEFAPVGTNTGWEILTRECDPKLVKFEIDLGWIAAAGHDPATFLAQHSGRVRWLHLKDLKATTLTNFALKMDPTEVGSGKQNWPAILKAAQRAGVEHYYVEQEPPFAITRMQAVQRSFDYLAQV